MIYPSLKDKNLGELLGVLLGDGSIGIYKCRSKNKISYQHRVKMDVFQLLIIMARLILE